MKDKTIEASALIASTRILEKIDLLRSTLRWAGHLERPDIQKLLEHCNALREEVLQLSSKERFIEVSRDKGTRASQSLAKRRQALLDRNIGFEGVFGDSPKLIETLEIAEKTARTDLPVLIDGESGTGKELLARVIHSNSRRANKQYVSVNCGAIPENLLESELFGHKKGAFTGAIGDRKGKFESANNGTIFLDEIGELPLQGQVKLLRALQSCEIQRVGSDEMISVDVRIVAATNKHLSNMITEGTFREDLFYRLSVVHVTLPPLRERRDEIPLLIAYFADEAALHLSRAPVRITPRLRRYLMGYEYPGNIRELRNIIYRLSCLADDDADIGDLPEAIRPKTSERLEVAPNVIEKYSLSDVKKAASDAAEKQFLEEALTEAGGKVVELARRIKVNRSHLQTLLKKHGIRSREIRARERKN